MSDQTKEPKNKHDIALSDEQAAEVRRRLTEPAIERLPGADVTNLLRSSNSDGIRRKTAMNDLRVPAEFTEDKTEASLLNRTWFEVRRKPSTFLAEARRCNRLLRTDILFGKRISGVNIDYIMEAMTAGEFAGLISHDQPCDVSLIPAHERFPDFRLFPKDNSAPTDYECVWADEKDRNPTQEYREYYERKERWDVERQRAIEAGDEDPGEYLETEEYSPYTEEQYAREAIPRVIREKAAKGYPRSTRLVIRNNVGPLRPEEYWRLSQPWLARFGEIWILKAPLLLQVHPRLQFFGDPSEWELP